MEAFWNYPVSGAAPVRNGLETYPDVDMELMQRAARALRTPGPADLKVLMDALQQRHGAEYIYWRETATADAATVGYIDDPLHRPSATIVNISEKVGVSTEEMLRIALRDEDEFRSRARVSAAAVNVTDLATHALIGRHAYFATPEMSEVILSGATRDIKDLALTPADLPSPQGLLLMNRPDGSAVLWWAPGPDNAIWASTKSVKLLEAWLLSDPRDVKFPLHPYVMATLSHPMSDEAPVVRDVVLPFEALAGHAPDRGRFDEPDASGVLQIFLSFAHMIRQEIADVSAVSTPPAPVIDKKGRKRFRKDTITFLSVRRSPSKAGRGESHREYSHRWVVRGHWRRQWYPSEGRHKPKWIMEYIAGPEDAPLLVHDKVTIVDRPAE